MKACVSVIGVIFCLALGQFWAMVEAKEDDVELTDKKITTTNITVAVDKDGVIHIQDEQTEQHVFGENFGETQGTSDGSHLEGHKSERKQRHYDDEDEAKAGEGDEMKNFKKVVAKLNEVLEAYESSEEGHERK